MERELQPSNISKVKQRFRFQKILTPKANPVNLGHSRCSGALRGAELKSSICPAQKFVKIEKFNMAAMARLKCIHVQIFLNKQGKTLRSMLVGI